MRELKARVWDIRAKCYIKDPVLFDNFGQVYVICEEASSRKGTCLITHKPNVILERYTGLKDKNGKEIYEGDIIREKWFDEDARRGENRVGKCEYFTDGFVCWFVGGRFIPLGMFPVSHIEVIGNIHENPELCGEEEECES